PAGSLDAIAHRAGAGSPLLVVTDARRREVYWARYDAAGTRVEGPCVSRPIDLPLDGVSRVAGGSDLQAGVLDIPVDPPRHHDPAALVAVVAAAVRSQAAPGPLTQLYLRRPDAVEPGQRKRVSPG
ncbi:MAG: tRNA (adenosine(37)-N6)-threonylcarbamoyltransferase complex dimerization subunit type 1 TsaB, partial [Pseudonocardiaceae bacterium]